VQKLGSLVVGNRREHDAQGLVKHKFVKN
jgi:hypothetical protein